MTQSADAKWMTHGEAGLGALSAVSAFVLVFVAAKAADGAFAFQIGTALVGDRDELLDRVRTDAIDTGLAWRYGVARFLSLLGAMILFGGGFWALRRPASVVSEPRVQGVLGVSLVAFVVGSWAAFTSFAAQVRDGQGNVTRVVQSFAILPQRLYLPVLRR